MSKKKWFLWSFLFCVFTASIVSILKYKPLIDTSSHFQKESINTDIESYLSKKELNIPGIRKGLEKQVVWVEGKKNRKTNISIVYIHGFSASCAPRGVSLFVV